jgi:hypothetical protein
MTYELLSEGADAKTVKGRKYGWMTGILYLAPANESGMGVNLCPMASPECRKACLYGAGMSSVYPSIKRNRIRKTKLYITARKEFIAALKRDVAKLAKTAREMRMKPAVRLNGTSDQPKLARELATAFPDAQFYDYTKIPKPWMRVMPNYHLTFSFSGTNMAECMKALDHGVNVAVVFAGELPATWQGYRVVDGDQNDLRFLDAKGVIVGLSTKGDAKKLAAGGFVQIGKVA